VPITEDREDYDALLKALGSSVRLVRPGGDPSRSQEPVRRVGRARARRRPAQLPRGAPLPGQQPRAHQDRRHRSPSLASRGREELSPSPSFEPCGRSSRTRLSSRWFPHRGLRAARQAVSRANSPAVASRHSASVVGRQHSVRSRAASPALAGWRAIALGMKPSKAVTDPNFYHLRGASVLSVLGSRLT